MKGLRSWWWGFGCLGMGLLLLVGCDTSDETDNPVSHVRIVMDTQALPRSGYEYPISQALVQSRQIMDALSISRILVEVWVPEDNTPIIAEVVDVTGTEVLIDLVVPQGTDRRIRVDTFNPFTAVIFSGETVVDLFLPVHDVELFLAPIFSANVALEAQVSADAGALLTVASESLGLLDLIVDIPPGALDRNGLVRIGTRNHPSLLPSLPSKIIPLGPILAFESDGTSLTQPIALTMPYDAIELSNLNLGLDALRFYYLDLEREAWSAATIVHIDPAMATLTVTIPAFGSGIAAVYRP